MTEPWHTYRNGGYDVHGEWVASNSWTAGKTVVRSKDPGLSVRLRVQIQGRRSQRYLRVRPHMWSAALVLGRTQVRVAHGSCKSVADALRQADAVHLREHLRVVSKKAYVRPFTTRCVFKKEGDGFYPFASLLEVDSHDLKNWQPLGYGDYHYAYRFGKEIKWASSKVGTGSLTGSFPSQHGDLGLKPWFPAIETAA